MMNRLHRFIQSGLLFGLLFVLLSGLMTLPLARSAPPGRNNNEPVIDRKSPVANRNQVGVVKNDLVILCPTQSKSIDLTARVSGRFTAQATSANPQIAAASISTSNRNHILLTIQAGENNSDHDQITTVTVTLTHEVLQTGIPPAPPAGSFDDGYGIHGSGPNSRPHGVDPRRDTNSTGQITVRVLSKKTCDALPPPEETTRTAAIPGDGGRTSAAQAPRNVRLCVRTSRNLNMQNEITHQESRMNRNDRRRTPMLRGLRIESNTSPAVASAQVMANYGRDGNQTNDPVYLLFQGLSEGETTITVSEFPLPVNVIPFRQSYLVKVEACDADKRREFIRMWSAVPHGYQVMPVQPMPQREDPFDDEFDFGEEQHQEQVPGNQQQQQQQQEEDQASTGLQHSDDGQLAKLSGDVNGANLAIQCPADAQEGEMISCSVYQDDQPVTDNYVIEVTSTATFHDGEEAPQTRTALGVNNGLFSLAVPAGVFLKDRPIGLTIKNPEGQTLCHGKLPVKPAGTHPSTPAAFSFPSEVTGQPKAVRIGGPFGEPVGKTSVTVDGKPAAVLAKSPRGVVVAPPENMAPGQNVWTVTEGDVSATQVIRHLPATTGGGSEGAEQEQPVEALTPMQQAIRNMCNMTIQTYRDNMRAMVDQGWNAPKPPSKGVWTAKLKYDLLRDGRVANIRVVSPSGYEPIDQSAIQRVNQMQGTFRPLPSCFDKSSMEIDHTFRVIYR